MDVTWENADHFTLMQFQVDAVQNNIPLLIRLENMDKYGLQFLSVGTKLQCVPGKWSLPVHRKIDMHI